MCLIIFFESTSMYEAFSDLHNGEDRSALKIQNLRDSII